ncbi:hypothetical protein A2110_00125 [Candidatus Jorgensenbacteria bacterium GWA1_54_12]|uniref:Uncharacterized protein n=1 Tax=Candidatus Jorgensenbacteria bacterium GWA1_54_12 TaxID=1798468 RepID=A0A1F6BIM4_9BACT|nr:MAG: hypothetical protein A2110_00125 [Candidatus Jorgensenbacteria bacterium GWA1_54_12]
MSIKSFLFRNTGTRQTVIKNTFWLSASEFGSRLLRAGAIIYAARALGAAQYGIFSYVLGLAGFFTVFADVGVKQIMTREVSQKPEEANAYFATAFWIKGALLFITSLLVIFVAPHFSKIEGARALVPLVALLTVFDNLREFSAGYFRGKEEMQYEALLTLTTNVAIAIFSFVIITVAPTARALTVTYILSAGTGTVLGFILLRKQFARIVSDFKKTFLTRIIHSAWPIALMGLVGAFTLNVDIIMLGFYKTAETVGFYAASQKIVQLLYMLPVIMAVATFPSLARFVKNKNTEKARMLMEKTVRAIYLIAIPLAVGGLILAPGVIRFLYGEGYEPAAPILRLLVLTPLVVYPAGIVSNFVFAHDEQKKIAPFVVIGSLLNVVLNVLLIPSFGALGAAFATLVSQAVYNGGIWFRAKRIMQFKTLSNLKRAVIASGIMGFAAIVLQLLGVHILVNIILSIGIYAGVLYLLEEDIILELKRVLLPRLVSTGHAIKKASKRSISQKDGEAS